MEAFQLLARGGLKFDKKRFQEDVQLFDVRRIILIAALHAYLNDSRKQNVTKARVSLELLKGICPRN